MELAGSSQPANPAHWSGWLLGQAAVGKGGRAACSPASASSCPAPADEARCGGRMLRGEQDWGQHSLCQPAPGVCWSWMTALYFGLHLPGMLQSHGWLFSRARSTHTGDPHPCLDLGTVLTSPCEAQSAAPLLSPAITQQSVPRGLVPGYLFAASLASLGERD